jgi:hypothetical protein
MSDNYRPSTNFIPEIWGDPDAYGLHMREWSLIASSSPTEHVLRGSKSFTARSFHSRVSTNSLRVPSTQSTIENFAMVSNPVRADVPLGGGGGGMVLGEVGLSGQAARIGTHKLRPSPTPSLKKSAAQAIVKSHGSPSHVRVTAGGRIVPSEQSPLCQPRYGYSAVKANGGFVKFAPNHRGMPQQWTSATEDGSVAQDVNGNLCQIVNGIILPLREVDGGLRLYVDAPNLTFTHRGAQPHFPYGQGPGVPPAEPPVEAQVAALELQYDNLTKDLKDVDRTEATHGASMSRHAKQMLVARRISLVKEMDQIRRAVKDLKNRPPAAAPTSPRAMRLAAAAYHPMPALTFGQHVGPFAAPDFASQPPTFDGSAYTSVGPGNEVPPYGMPHAFRQFGGPRSVVSANVGAAHAVTIKAPDNRAGGGLKSRLNPMSPIYKPGGVEGKPYAVRDNTKSSSHRPPPASASSHAQQPSSAHVSTNATETINSAKKNAHLHSSSSSSFGTADFFPGNPREYSTRQHAYGEDKENTDPELFGSDPGVADCVTFKTPIAPPGTPVNDTTSHAPLPSKADTDAWTKVHVDVPNRDTHNVSPKNKREWRFVHERPEETLDLTTSSPAKPHVCQEKVCEATTILTIDFTHKSIDWLEGYQAGLQRRAVSADRMGDFLDGYCSGLLKSKPLSTSLSTAVQSTSSPTKSQSRRPSTALASRSSSRLHQADEGSAHRSSWEVTTKSLDILKQPYPQSEKVARTPSVDGLNGKAPPPNQTAWSAGPPLPNSANNYGEQVPGFPVPKRGSSADHRRAIMSDSNNSASYRSKALLVDRALNTPQSTSNKTPAPTNQGFMRSNMAGIASNPGSRLGSLGSVDSNMQNPWPNTHVMTPADWRSAGAFSQPTALTTGYFAHGQFDGTNDVCPYLRAPGPLTFGPVGAPQRVTSVTSDASQARMVAAGRFREGSLDATAFPASAQSPPASPDGTPVRTDSKKTREVHLRKGSSPTKAKFEHFAEKVGIKVSAAEKPEDGDGA